jgi:hypothetical protein
MRTRTLLSTEVGACYKIYIDNYFTDNLILLDLYNGGSTTNQGYDIY